MIDPDRSVWDLTEEHPCLLQALVDEGFAPLANPVVRRVMAKRTSLRQACERKGKDLDAVVMRMQATIAADPERNPQ